MTTKTNVHLTYLIEALKTEANTNKVDLWKRVACDLEKSTRARREVNLSRINRVTSDKDIIIVPGKVLGSGVLNHSVTVAAWNFSSSAKQRIEQAKGSAISILDLLKKDPKAKNVKIIG